MDRLANGIDPFEEAVSEIVTDERDRSVASYFLLARQLNFETIHNHEVLAERFGMVGELRGELSGSGHEPRHTQLSEWLAS